MQSFTIRVLKVLTDIVWYLLLALIIFVYFVILLRLFTGGHINRDIPVQLKSPVILPPLATNSTAFQFNHIIGADALLKVNMKMTPGIAAYVLIGFTVFSVLATLLVSSLRKIIRSLR